MRDLPVRVYIAPDCTLCDRLIHDLMTRADRLRIRLEIVDIRAHPRWLRDYFARVPVVDVAGIFELDAPVTWRDVAAAVRSIRTGVYRQRRIYSTHWRWLGKLEQWWNRRSGYAWRQMLFDRIRRHHTGDRVLYCLELAPGPGLNRPWYPHRWRWVWIDSSPLWGPPAGDMSSILGFVRGDIHALPFRDGVFDLVVDTFTLCAVWNLDRLIHEVHRVLKPNGTWWWLDHGRADGWRARLQRWIRPVWFRVLGCFPDQPFVPRLQRDRRFQWEMTPVYGRSVWMGRGIKVADVP